MQWCSRPLTQSHFDRIHAASKTPAGFQAGVLLFRNCAWTRDFLAEMARLSHIYQRPYDPNDTSADGLLHTELRKQDVMNCPYGEGGCDGFYEQNVLVYALRWGSPATSVTTAHCAVDHSEKAVTKSLDMCCAAGRIPTTMPRCGGAACHRGVALKFDRRNGVPLR